MSSRKFHLGINWLRAISILGVVSFHTDLGISPNGYLGVDVFFVLSGFLMTNLISQGISDENFSFLDFYQRRIRRILPALYVMLSIVSLVFFNIMLPAEFKLFSQSLVSAVIFLPNVYFSRTTGYFSPSSLETPLIHTWSLGVEEQFYIVLPILLWVMFKYLDKYLNLLVGSVFFSSLLLNFVFKDENNFSFYSIFTRAWELLIGVILALKLSKIHQGKPLERWVVKLAHSILFSLLITPWFGFLNQYLVLMICLIITCLIIADLDYKLGYGESKYLIIRFFKKKYHQIGLMSFSLYLWHQPIFALFRLMNLNQLNDLQVVFAVITALIFGYLSWK